MKGKRIIFYILGTFIAGIFLLIYIQYNSSKNISNLINGNNKLMDGLRVKREMEELKSDIFQVENKIRGTVSTRDSIYIEGLEEKIMEIEANLNQLQKITDDDTTIKYVDTLDRLVHEKLILSRQMLDTLSTTGTPIPEGLVAAHNGKRVADSILLISKIIDTSRQRLLARAALAIDRSGKGARDLGNILIAMVLLAAACLFWYIINTIRKQGQLIMQLNVSEKKVKETARIKENFMANMSHEIRTPMNAILGFTNLLQRSNLDSQSMQYVQTIRNSGENLLNIINDILDLSKIEAGMMRIEPALFSIRDLLNSVENIFKPKASEKQLQLIMHVDEDVPDTLEGDATRLTQILVNLVGNALKFTGKGNISVNVSNDECIDNIVTICLTVADTGIGIEKEKLQHIFGRFQQAEDSFSRKYGGTGLGLSIVKELVLLQNGQINVESEPGKGTTFRVRIPYKLTSPESNALQPAETELAEQPGFENVLILAVEDNEINQSLLKHLFKNWKIEYDIANDGNEAIDKLRRKKYDLILMDVQLPGMDGYTAAGYIRNELKTDTPIIAMTAHAFAGEKEKCIRHGMNEYISKPISEQHLYNLIAGFTQVDNPAALKNEIRLNIPPKDYQYITLQYMKEISCGNTDYEKTVTGQFITALPADLQAMENAWHKNDINQMQQIAHNMKTTLSIMGLSSVLQPYLDALEYEVHGEEDFTKNFCELKSIGLASVEEAKNYYATL